MSEIGMTRLVVHRTPRHMYAQIIVANGSEVVTAASTLEKDIREQIKSTGNTNAAEALGEHIAKRALEKDISEVAFDRSGFKYHGRVKALADSARRAGLKF
jgi:large subunit ribosomal protein L18